MVISLLKKRALNMTIQLACPLSFEPVKAKCFRCAFYQSEKCPREKQKNNVIDFPITYREPFQQQNLHLIAQSRTP
jgi:hypothetical protein